MEEWHQKLHNNTSPDDVVICQVFRIYVNNCFANLNPRTRKNICSCIPLNKPL